LLLLDKIFPFPDYHNDTDHSISNAIRQKKRIIQAMKMLPGRGGILQAAASLYAQGFFDSSVSVQIIVSLKVTHMDKNLKGYTFESGICL
jgi:hypothetical protein